MRSHRLYCPELREPTVALSPEESHHAATALRLSAGDDVILFNGAGTEANGLITRVTRKRVDVEVSRVKQVPFELTCRLTLGVAMGRAHRQGYLVEKCTELGVAAIWPLIAERSTVRPGAAAVTRWTRRAIEAAKQSQRAWVPVIEAPATVKATIARAAGFDVKAIADVGAAAIAFPTLLARNRHARSMLILVGPEGGWSDAERRQAVGAGLLETGLGPTILRSETAAVAACAGVAMHFARSDPAP